MGAEAALAEEVRIENAYFGFAGMGEVYTLAEGHFFWMGEFTGAMAGLTGSGTFSATPKIPHANGVVSSYALGDWNLVTP